MGPDSALGATRPVLRARSATPAASAPDGRGASAPEGRAARRPVPTRQPRFEAEQTRRAAVNEQRALTLIAPPRHKCYTPREPLKARSSHPPAARPADPTLGGPRTETDRSAHRTERMLQHGVARLLALEAELRRRRETAAASPGPRSAAELREAQEAIEALRDALADLRAAEGQPSRPGGYGFVLADERP